MSSLWVPLDVNFLWDQAVLACDFEAQILYVRSLCMSKQTLSNGFISRKQVAALCFDMDDHGTLAVKQLVEHELWTEDGDGHQIRSWLKHNKSAADVAKLKEARREAGRRGGLKSASSKRQASASSRIKPEVEVDTEVEGGRDNTPATRIPLPWTVDEEMITWARDNVPDVDWENESRQFVDHFKASSAKSAVKCDWRAAWQKWMRDAQTGAFR